MLICTVKFEIKDLYMHIFCVADMEIISVHITVIPISGTILVRNLMAIKVSMERIPKAFIVIKRGM